MKGKAILLLSIFFLFTSSGNAFQVGEGWSNGLARIEKIYSFNFIEGKDLRTYIIIEFTLDSNFSQLRNNATIVFSALERDFVYATTENEYSACFGSYSGWGYGERAVDCSQNISLKVDYNKDNFNQNIALLIPQDNISRRGVIRVSYTLPDFIIQQGSYEVAWLQYPISYNLESWIVLPKNTSIPYRFPDNVEPRWQGNYTNGKWAFVFTKKNQTLSKGIPRNDIMIWYTDAEEIQKHENDLLWKGAIAGFALSLILYLVDRWKTRGDNEKILKKVDGINNQKVVSQDNKARSTWISNLFFLGLGYLLLKRRNK